MLAIRRLLKVTVGIAFAAITSDHLRGQVVATSFQFPLATTWTITQSFDTWNDDFWGMHLAEDVVVKVPLGGTKADTELPVHAAGTGVVKHVGYHAGYGWVVLIEHSLPAADPLGPKVTTLYAHLRNSGLIQNNIPVTKGATVGYLSSDKNENGGYTYTHIHFGVKKGSVLANINACHPITRWWLYAGYSALFGQCHLKSTLIKVGPDDSTWSTYSASHQTVVSEWVRPSEFVNARSSAPPTGAIQWPVAEGGNGHWYELVSNDFSLWPDARAKAAAKGGYLATLTSANENSWVLQHVLTGAPPGTAAWIGGADLSLSGDWKWVEGPEAGQLFWKSGVGTITYSNWGAVNQTIVAPVQSFGSPLTQSPERGLISSLRQSPF